MTTWLMANPKAGRGERGADFWKPHLEAAGISGVHVCDLDARGWMSRVGPDDLILAAGGDGSVNQAAALCADMGATLAVLPSGTANDFARNLGLPLNDPPAICEIVAQRQTQQVDVASLGERIFLNVAHIGLGTRAVRESSSRAKRLMGRFSYGASLLRSIFSRYGFRASIEYDEGIESGRWLSIAIANGAFYGGGNEIPTAAVDDGMLDIIAVRPRHPFQLLVTFLAVRLRRRAPPEKTTVVHIRSSRCEIRTHRPETVTADGELVGKTPLRVSCRQRCLTVISPHIQSA
ncbi:diacylglycerol/lipid kinase family protein [Marinobacter sp.]|uniref:diacylglycerol/lipid kinase family protein n=1 Tax=Marinobacter sp. TaxID=50741 RepID=UPI00384FD9C2